MWGRKNAGAVRKCSGALGTGQDTEHRPAQALGNLQHAAVTVATGKASLLCFWDILSSSHALAGLGHIKKRRLVTH